MAASTPEQAPLSAAPRPKLSRLLGALTLVVGLLVAIAWLLDIQPLKDAVPGFATMKLNTAIDFVFLGGAILLASFDPARPQTLRNRFALLLLCAVICVVSLANLAEYALDVDLGIDQLLIRDFGGEISANPPGRMAIITAVNFLLLGLALGIWQLRRGAYHLWQGLALVSVFLSSVALLGYLYGASSLHRIYPYSSMAVHTAGTLLLAAFGILHLRPRIGFMAAFTGTAYGALMGRRLLPLSLLALILLGFVIRHGGYPGFYDTGFDLVFLVALGSAVITVLVRWSAEQLTRQEEIARLYAYQLKLVIDHAPTAVALLDRQMRYLWVSQRWISDYRLSRRDIIGRSHYEVFPEISERWKEIHRRALAGSVERADEDEFVRADGSVNWIRWEVRPWYEIRGEIGGLAIFSEDITARKLATEALRKAKEELESRVEERTRDLELQSTIVRNMAEGVFLVGAEDGCIVYANPRFETLFGYSSGELAGKHVSLLNMDEPPGTAQRRFQEIHDAIRDRGQHTYEVRNRRKDGTPFWCRATASRFMHPRFGEVFVVVQEDITARKGAEDELRRSEQRYHDLVELAIDGIFIADLNGRYTDVNRAGAEMLGYSHDEIVGKNIADLLPPEDVPILESARQELLRPGATHIAEWKLRKKDGTYLDVEVSAKIYPDRRWLGFVRDITARKKAEEELREYERELARSNVELEQFAYVASHDLREPLRVVTNYAQLLERRYRERLDETGRKYIGYIVSSVARMQALIGDLLTYSRVGRGELAPQPVDLGSIVAEVQSDLRVKIRETRAQLNVGPLPSLPANPLQMGQLFLNLLDNAIKFHRPGIPPQVEIRAERSGSDWLFTVKDNGIGIEPQYLDRIFVIFQRLHPTDEYPGTGIGLAIAKKIVERHGGRIWVESQGGPGATFRFTLPALSTAAEPEPRLAG